MTAAKLLATLVAAIDDEGLGAYGVHVRVQNDVASHRWRSDDRENVYSVSKGVCVLAVGIAVDAGLISLDQRVDHAFPDMVVGVGTGAVTLRDLLQMRSGIDFEWFGDQEVPWPDLAAEMLGRDRGPIPDAFQYSDASTYVAMRMLAETVGDVRDWLIPRLFAPLGIHNPQWHRCPQGYIVGGSGLELRTSELAAIGTVLLDGLAPDGTRIVSANWIEAMTDWVETGFDEPWSAYGLATWRGPGATWRLDGRYGQYVVVDRRTSSVVTITAHEEERDERLAELAADALGAFPSEP